MAIAVGKPTTRSAESQSGIIVGLGIAGNLVIDEGSSTFQFTPNGMPPRKLANSPETKERHGVGAPYGVGISQA